MNTLRATILLGLCALSTACVFPNQVLVLRSHGLLQPGSRLAVKVEVPGDLTATYPVTRGRDAAGYHGPDNYTSMAILVRRVGIPPSHCPEAARKAASDAVALATEMTKAVTERARPLLFDQYLWAGIYPNEATVAALRPQLSSTPENPEVVDYWIDRLTPPGFPEGPEDRFVIGRAMCRRGFLVIVSCSGGVARKATMGPVCEQITRSLAIELESGDGGQQKKEVASALVP